MMDVLIEYIANSCSYVYSYVCDGCLYCARCCVSMKDSVHMCYRVVCDCVLLGARILFSEIGSCMASCS